MAKRKTSSVNKSAAVRDYIASHPNATPKDIQAALTNNGIDVSVGLASVVKYSKRKSGGKRGRPKAVVKAGDRSAADLIAAKKLVDSMPARNCSWDGHVAQQRRSVEQRARDTTCRRKSGAGRLRFHPAICPDLAAFKDAPETANPRIAIFEPYCVGPKS